MKDTISGKELRRLINENPFAAYRVARGRMMPGDAEALSITPEPTPYGPMCRDPSKCAGKGYCPLDPTCGD